MANCCSKANDQEILISTIVHKGDTINQGHEIYEPGFDSNCQLKKRIFAYENPALLSSPKKETIPLDLIAVELPKHRSSGNNERINPATGEHTPGSREQTPTDNSSTSSRSIDVDNEPELESSDSHEEIQSRGAIINNERRGSTSTNAPACVYNAPPSLPAPPSHPKRNPKIANGLSPVMENTVYEDEDGLMRSHQVSNQGINKRNKIGQTRKKGLPPLVFEKTWINENTPIVSEKLVIDGNEYLFELADLVNYNGNDPLGVGGYGKVFKQKHLCSGRVIAVKIVQVRLDANLKRELEILEKGREKGSEYIVEYYGSLKQNSEVFIAMELMKTSVDKIANYVYITKQIKIPEKIVKHICFGICSALEFLAKTLIIIHRDVKPSNMLVGYEGEIKICDFGISADASVAKTKEVGCRPYMAPERLDQNIVKYSIKCDVWSFGISMIEIITGEFPYKNFSGHFEQWNQIVMGEPPQLELGGDYNEQMVNFINPCLMKMYSDRPHFSDLLKSEFLENYNYNDSKGVMAHWMQEIKI